MYKVKIVHLDNLKEIERKVSNLFMPLVSFIQTTF